MSLINIKKLLRQSIGLNASSIGDSSIERAVKHRLNSLKLSSIDDYYQLLLENAQEASEFIEEIVVPETWFFRNSTPFDAVRDYFLDSLQTKLLKNEVIRILSVPCASGEEAYSIVITLLSAGISLHNVEIDAMDISKRALVKARRAIYCKNSFRGVDDTLREKYFEKEGADYRLKADVRNRVDFKQGNILVGPLSPKTCYYDIIFCRNLLIYFDRETQHAAIDKLHRSLSDNGVLFLGHAETSLAPRNMFERLYSPRSFGFKKRDAASRDAINKTAMTLKHSDSKPSVIPPNVPDQWQEVFEQLAKLPTGDSDKAAFEKIILEHSEKTTNRSTNQSQHYQSKDYQSKNKQSHSAKARKTNKLSLRTAERLVNEGELEQALLHCEAFLQQSPNSSHAYYVMGLIKNSLDHGAAAEGLLRKAIYLDPNHEQALQLCSVLAAKRGDTEAAQSYQRRADRVAGRNNRPKTA